MFCRQLGISLRIKRALNASVLRCQNVKNSNVSQLLVGRDPQQVTLLDEPCIVVDHMDKVLGKKSKKDVHLFIDNSTGILHRAFSVFLFNSKGNLLLQRRSSAKITFPGCYSNTCCSHPLFIDSELEEGDAIGIKIAAQRRLEFELGIPRNQIPLNKIDYITRIHYCAAADAPWGEHEMDYILFIKADITVKQNTNEVSECCYVSRDQLANFISSLAEKGVPITPWFKLICDSYLPYWWENLNNVEAIMDQKAIHRML